MKSGRKFTGSLGRFAICVVLLVWIFHAIFVLEGKRQWERAGKSWSSLSRTEQWEVAWSEGPPELWRTLRLVKPTAFALSLGFMGLTIFLGTVRWRMVLKVQGLELSFARVAEISLVAHFFNSFLLGSTGGDVLKAYYAARETHHKKTEAVMTVLIDRLLGLFAMLLFACVMMAPNWDVMRSSPRTIALGWTVFLMLMASAVLVGLSFWGGVSKAWPRFRALLAKLPKGDQVERAVEACRQFGREHHFVYPVFLLSMVLNAICVLQIVALVKGMGLPVPTLALFAIVPIIVSISALPITPSGLGVRENLYVLMLTIPAINIEATQALSLSLLAYSGSLIWSVIGGMVYASRKERDRLPEIKEADALTDAL